MIYVVTEGQPSLRNSSKNGGYATKICCNVTGHERKSLVGAISTALNAPTKYLGAPTFAYEVGGYHIDKSGTVVGLDDEELIGRLTTQGFTGEVEYDSLPTFECIEHRDAEKATVEEQTGCEDGTQAGEVPEADKPNRLTVEFPLEGFSPELLDNLVKMVTAKETLIKAALGADDLPIQVTGDTVKFPWFTLADPSHAANCVQFVFALCTAAKEKKRVTAKEHGVSGNPKYAMRCWLLSLGLIGDKYKNARKLLLARLDGNSSFKGGGRPTYTAHCYTYPNGSEEDAMDCETKEFTSLAKAKAHCDGFLADCESLKFAGAHVEDDDGAYLYEILTDGTVNEK